MSTTIIYYTSNRERPEFEKKVQENILKVKGDIPIISVSQKPMDFGKNVCIGDVGVSGFNALRQIQIACCMAKTKYVISAEADCLYPPDYFQFVPPKDDACYRNTNTYIVGQGRGYFWYKKEGGVWAQAINTKFYIERLSLLFKGEMMWNVGKVNFPKENNLAFFDTFEYFRTENPCISFKTGKGMRHYSHSARIPVYDLPYWGDSKTLIRRMYDHT